MAVREENTSEMNAIEQFRVLQEKYNIENADQLIEYIDSVSGDEEEVIAGMQLQLETLYAEKENLTQEIHAATFGEIRDAFESLTAQLEMLYAEREKRSQRGLDDEMGALENLEMQLGVLYQERESLEERFGVSGGDQIRMMLESLEAQLRTLYAERENYVIVDGDSLVIQGPRKYFIKKSDSV